MKTDSLFYRLLQAEPALLFELAGLTVPDPGHYRFHSQELKQTAFRLDGLLEPPTDRPDAPRVFVEVQFQPDAEFYPRFLGEILLYHNQYPSARPWHAVVLYPSSTVERYSPMSEPFLTLPNLHRLYLNQLPLLDSPHPRLWLIALILADTARIRPIVAQVQFYRASHPDDGSDWLDLLETVLVYKLPQFTRQEIQAMFGFNDVELKETRFYQEAFGEGRVEGFIEGETQGLVKGEAALLLRQLERKFPPLPETARQRIAAADAETLLVWGERMLDAHSLDDIWGH